MGGNPVSTQQSDVDQPSGSSELDCSNALYECVMPDLKERPTAPEQRVAQVFERSSAVDAVPSYANDRTSLFERASGVIGDSTVMAKFRDDMKAFEDRAAKSNIKPEEIGKSYQAISSMLQENPNASTTLQQRAILASQIMRNLANPIGIDQGNNDTCVAKSLEILLYSKRPADAVNIVTQTANTGRYTAADGLVTTIPKGAFTPAENSLTIPPVNRERSFAGQLFDHTAINAYFKSKGEPIELRRISTGDTTNPPGDYLFNANTGENLGILDGLKGHPSMEIYRLLTGDRSNQMIDFSPSGELRPGVLNVKDLSGLRTLLTNLAERNQFPMMTSVNLGMPPFFRDHYANTKVTEVSAGHILNIVGFDPRTNKVLVDNQIGSETDRISADRSIPLEQFMYSMASDSEIFNLTRQTTEALNPGDNQHQLMLKTLAKMKELHSESAPSIREYTQQEIGLALGDHWSSLDIGAIEERRRMQEEYNQLSPYGKLATLFTMNSNLPNWMSEADYNRRLIRAVADAGLMNSSLTSKLEATNSAAEVPQELRLLRQLLQYMPADRRERLLRLIPR